MRSHRCDYPIKHEPASKIPRSRQTCCDHGTYAALPPCRPTNDSQCKAWLLPWRPLPLVCPSQIPWQILVWIHHACRMTRFFHLNFPVVTPISLILAISGMVYAFLAIKQCHFYFPFSPGRRPPGCRMRQPFFAEKEKALTEARSHVTISAFRSVTSSIRADSTAFWKDRYSDSCSNFLRNFSLEQ